MAILLDTENKSDIRKYFKRSIIHGVTTNPSISFKDDVSGGIEGIHLRTFEITQIIKHLPISVEVTSNERSEMHEQA